MNRASGLVFESEFSTGVMPDVATTLDRSRYKNHGTNTNITYTRLPSGLWAHDFNGVTSTVIKAGAIGLPLGITNSSLCTWFKANGLQDSLMLEHGQHGIGNLRSIYLTSGGMVVAGGWGADLSFGATCPYTSNNWYFAVVTYEGGTVRTYLSDKIGDTGAPGLNTFGPTITMSPGGTYLGSLALPRIYNYTLTAGQILNIFERERRLFGV